ncbi:alkyl sulfatase dimerization domain-containing protein [Comamonas terrae]|uniref:Alkyl sulfatase dimerization domain-containing protein n=1 Tax=Comamonas terrae TaxID=673548 RepID=A0ABW5UM36_9BURK|nr:alkyl sulfatase dimerization domain-containing protein [Comamonas terrae]
MNGKDDDKPFLLVGTGSETVAPGLHILRGQGQSFVAETDAGLVLIDAGPGGSVTQGMIESLRQLSDAPVHALCYSHGHIGYNAGVPQWLEHARQRGEPAPRIIAHRNVPRRHARYRETQALQHRMAEVQFNRSPGFFEHRLTMHEPTETFDERLVIGSGEQRIELLWAPSETDDAIALWSPAQRVLYGGAALLDSIPNIGTPFRTLRDTMRWAGTLEALAALGPRIAVREFGPVIEGEDQVRQVLTHTARALRWLRAEVVRLMNEGLNEQQVLARMHYPEELFGVPWMKPTYGDPSYIVRDIYRSENGWWDRNPSTLHPEPPEAVGAAVAQAIADKPAVIASARALADAGRWQLALHVIDLLATAHGDAPEIAQARALKAAWLRERATQVASYVSRNLYKVSADMIEQGTQGRFGIR